MIKRTDRARVLKFLYNKVDDPAVVDLGCHRGAWPAAGVACDIKDFSSCYPTKEFVRTDICQTPFADGRFEFSIACHIAEHVKDPKQFVEELQRISKGGYIEVPTPLFDNLVIGNANAHLWWVTFDDATDELVFRKRRSIVRPSVDLNTWTFLKMHFKESLITALVWNGTFAYRIEEQIVPRATSLVNLAIDRGGD